MLGSLDFGFGWLLRAVKPADIEALWRQFFEDPSQWSDVRTQKVPHSCAFDLCSRIIRNPSYMVLHLKIPSDRRCILSQ